MIPLRIYLVRHGETEWTRSGQYTGRTDIPLTAHGEAQAHALETYFRDIAFSRVLVSPRRRARQTCELAGLGAAAVIDSDLSEWDYGDYEGRRSRDILVTRPGWNLFRDGCPHGESPAQMAERADRIIARLRKLEGTVALFSHGQFGCVFAARWIRLPVAEAQHFAFGEASFGILGYDPHHPEVAVIAQWNAAAPDLPLAGQGTPDAEAARQRTVQRWENEGGEVPAVPRTGTI